MKLKILHQFFNKLINSFKQNSQNSRDLQEYQKVKKELRPLKTDKSFRPEKGSNQDISAI